VRWKFWDRKWPTVFHVTHYKAGSQWIHKLLHACAPDRIVTPQDAGGHILGGPLRAGMIYPTVYLAKPAFDSVSLPHGSRRFVVVRDLRDTLVSLYFSLKHSHVLLDAKMASLRAELQARSQEDGLLWLLNGPEFTGIADIHASWVNSGEPLVHYEDLLDHDEAIFERVLIDQCGMPIAREQLRETVRRCRFEALTGRLRGEQDVASHERKGIAGDWRNHFTEEIDGAFDARYGPLLRRAVSLRQGS
jgi:lipopolysaccharide transport system ATP-binding protein